MKKRVIDTTELIGQIYEGIGDSQALAKTIMEIVHLSSSRGAHYGVLDQAGSWLQAWSADVGLSVVQSYLTRYEIENPRAASWLSHPGEVVLRTETLTDREECERSALVNELLNKVDSRYALASTTPVGSGISIGFGVMRNRRDGPYGEHEIKAMGPLLYHIARAMVLQLRLGRLESHLGSMEALVDRLSTPVLLVDEAGMLRYANAAGQEALAKGKYLVLRLGRIAPGNPRQAQEFSQSLQAALIDPRDSSPTKDDHDSVALQLRSAEGHSALLVMRGLHGQKDLAGMPQAHAALFLSSSHEKPVPDAIRLQLVFGLTPAETRLAEHLLSGESLNEIAEHVRVGRETIRSQLRSLFAKTGTCRQAELIGCLLGSVSVPIV